MQTFVQNTRNYQIAVISLCFSFTIWSFYDFVFKVLEFKIYQAYGLKAYWDANLKHCYVYCTHWLIKIERYSVLSTQMESKQSNANKQFICYKQ